MKKTICFLCGLLSLLLTSSCSGYLDVVPENSQVADDYWRTQQDVESVLMGGYYYLRSTVTEYLIPWGECRAGLVYNSKSNTSLQSWQMQPSNSLCKWGTFYQIINVANTVLERADEACRNDDTYTEQARNSHYCEAYFLRALSYFYLVRNFRDVPLALRAYVDDKVDINLPKTSEDTLVAQIKSDILAALRTGAAKESFPTSWETKGRATKWALYALMADVCLWSGDYEEVITYCDALLDAKSDDAPAFLSSPSRASFMSIFNPGNSNESIFELQWNYEENQTNDLPLLFDDVSSEATYVVSPEACNDFVREYVAIVGDEEGGLILAESPRTYCSSLIAKGSSSKNGYAPGAISMSMSNGYVWKYIGSTSADKKRTANHYDPHFLIYRMADIILMKAEALLLVDGEVPTDAHKKEAVELLNRLRRRAGYPEETLNEKIEASETASQFDLLEELLTERKLESLGECKIWYDFLRLGRRDNNRYKQEFLIDQVCSYNTCASESWLRSVLNSDNSLFLPVNAGDIERNPNLVQNPYYN